MKQIILIRHAKVDNDNSKKILSKDLQKWVKSYNDAPICKDSNPPEEIVNLTKNADIVLTSSLKRTKASADKLSLEVDEKNSLFDEAYIPEVNVPFLKLTPMWWLFIIRVLSFLNLGKIGLSLEKSKLQAQKATKILTTLSTKNDKIILFGHGGMNWLIRKKLLKDGWKLKEKPSNKNWGTAILVK